MIFVSFIFHQSLIIDSIHLVADLGTEVTKILHENTHRPLQGTTLHIEMIMDATLRLEMLAMAMTIRRLRLPLVTIEGLSLRQEIIVNTPVLLVLRETMTITE